MYFLVQQNHFRFQLYFFLLFDLSVSLHFWSNFILLLGKVTNYYNTKTNRQQNVKQLILIMGNSQPTGQRKRNSYSLDNFQYSLDSKIKPINLQKINAKQRKSLNYSVTKQQIHNNQVLGSSGVYGSRLLLGQNKDKRLKTLNQQNDQLRSQLIKISKQLGQKLKKKKASDALKAKVKTQSKISTALQRQLENAYRQIDMYKRKIQKIKLDPNANPEAANVRVQGIENHIKSIDMQIQILKSKLQGIKNIHRGQHEAIQKNNDQAQSDDYYKKEINILKSNLKQFKRRDRQRQEKLKRQQIYLYELQKMISQINGDYYPDLEKKLKADKEKQDRDKNSRVNIPQEQGQRSVNLPSPQQVNEVEKEAIDLKIKHQQYKKKIQALTKIKNQLKVNKGQCIKMMKAKQSLIEGLRSKRDVLYKVVKSYQQAQKQRQQQLSEFSSDQQNSEKINEEGDNVFEIDHLKGEIPKKEHHGQPSLAVSQAKSEVKKWQKKITRILTKGETMNNQKQFNDQGLFKRNPQTEIFMVGMNLWLNKQKKIIGIQGVYLHNNEVKQGNKSCKNQEEYIIRYELSEGDFIKSIIAIFGNQGFLQHLIIRSKKNKLKKYGRQPGGGERLACGLSENQRPMLLSGSCALDGQCWRVNKLSIQVCLF